MSHLSYFNIFSHKRFVLEGRCPRYFYFAQAVVVVVIVIVVMAVMKVLFQILLIVQRQCGEWFSNQFPFCISPVILSFTDRLHTLKWHNDRTWLPFLWHPSSLLRLGTSHNWLNSFWANVTCNSELSLLWPRHFSTPGSMETGRTKPVDTRHTLTQFGDWSGPSRPLSPACARGTVVWVPI